MILCWRVGDISCFYAVVTCYNNEHAISHTEGTIWMFFFNIVQDRVLRWNAQRVSTCSTSAGVFVLQVIIPVCYLT